MHMGVGTGLDPSWASLPPSLWPYRILEHGGILLYNLESEGLELSQQLPDGPGTESHGQGLVLHPVWKKREIH